MPAVSSASNLTITPLNGTGSHVPPPGKLTLLPHTLVVCDERVTATRPVLFYPEKSLLLIEYQYSSSTGTVEKRLLKIHLGVIQQFYFFSAQLNDHIVAVKLNDEYATKLATSICKYAEWMKSSFEIIFTFSLERQQIDVLLGYIETIGISVVNKHFEECEQLLGVDAFRLLFYVKPLAAETVAEPAPKKVEAVAKPTPKANEPVALLDSSDDENNGDGFCIKFADGTSTNMSREVLAKNIAPKSWLNDVMVDFYIEYLMKNKLSEAEREDVHIFDCTFFQRLYKHKRVLVCNYDGEARSELPNLLDTIYPKRRNKRTLPLFKKKLLVVPVFWENHWMLLLIEGVGNAIWSEADDWSALRKEMEQAAADSSSVDQNLFGSLCDDEPFGLVIDENDDEDEPPTQEAAPEVNTENVRSKQRRKAPVMGPQPKQLDDVVQMSDDYLKDFNVKKCRFFIMDSKMHDPANVEILQRIHKVVFQMMKSWVKMMIYAVADETVLDRFSFHRCENLPDQPNSFDCGLFMLRFAERFACDNRSWMSMESGEVEEMDIGCSDDDFQEEIRGMRRELFELVHTMAGKRFPPWPSSDTSQ